MLSKRLLPVVAASLFVGAVACGGVTQFSVGSMGITGTPPAPPPPPPPPKPEEPPKPPPRVELRDNKIDFKEKIQFDNNKATIKEASFSLLHDIADVINKNTQVKKISIEGHASAEGDAKANKKLSDDRAKSVMQYLIDKEKVDKNRLTAKGWGIEKPIGDNNTEEGREKNRRVEFLVVEQDVTQKKVEIDPATGKERVVGESKESIKAPGSDTTAAPPSSAGVKSTTPAAAGSAKPATATKPAAASSAKPASSGGTK